MKLADVGPKKGEFVKATICYEDSNGLQHSIINQYIYPYRKELKGANNAVLFVDTENNIIGGQRGRYDYENGSHVVFFTESQEATV